MAGIRIDILNNNSLIAHKRIGTDTLAPLGPNDTAGRTTMERAKHEGSSVPLANVEARPVDDRHARLAGPVQRCAGVRVVQQRRDLREVRDPEALGQQRFELFAEVRVELGFAAVSLKLGLGGAYVVISAGTRDESACGIVSGVQVRWKL